MNMGGFFSSITLFSSIVYILTAVTGAAFIQKGHINAADLITYLLFVNTLLGTVDILVQFTEQYQQGIAGFQRYCNLMDTPEDISDKPDAIDIESFDGESSFRTCRSDITTARTFLTICPSPSKRAKALQSSDRLAAAKPRW